MNHIPNNPPSVIGVGGRGGVPRSGPGRSAEVVKNEHLSSTFAPKWPKVFDRWSKMASGAKCSVWIKKYAKVAIGHTVFASSVAESRQA